MNPKAAIIGGIEEFFFLDLEKYNVQIKSDQAGICTHTYTQRLKKISSTHICTCMHSRAHIHHFTHSYERLLVHWKGMFVGGRGSSHHIAQCRR